MLVKLIIGAIAVVGLLGLSTIFTQTSEVLKVDASPLREDIKQSLDTKFGDDWDDLIDDTYGDNWVEKIEAKYGKPINECILDEVTDLDILEQLEDQIENKLDIQFGDNWDDVLEKAYGDNWEQVLFAKYSDDFPNQLESELHNILKAHPEYEAILNEDEDKYDVSDIMADELDLKFGDDWDDVFEKVYGDNWEQKMYDKHGANFEKHLESELQNILEAHPEYEALLKHSDDVSDMTEQQLHLKFGDDWDDVFEKVYGDNWEQKMYEKYGVNFENQLESELQTILKAHPEYEAILKDANDLDDKYDVSDMTEQQLDFKFGDDWDELLEKTYGDNWKQKMYEKYGATFEQQLESELNKLMPTSQQ